VFRSFQIIGAFLVADLSTAVWKPRLVVAMQRSSCNFARALYSSRPVRIEPDDLHT
jgi:hypothetical protein